MPNESAMADLNGPDAANAVAEPYRPGYELVAEQLLHYMAEQNYRPGDRLPTEQGLAEALGATRNVTREAIKVLAAMGRLTVRRGAGMFVAASGDGAISDDLLVHFQPTDIEQVVMLLDHRRLIESETARRASRLATPIEVKGIRNAALASVEKSTSSNVADFGEADAHFHKAVAAAAHNVFLESSMATLRKYVAQSDLLLFHGDVAGSVEVAAAQHVAIADAIADGEPQLAASLMIDHINTTQAQFERRIKDRFSTFIRTDETPS